MERNGVAVHGLAKQELSREYDFGLVPPHMVTQFWPQVQEILREKKSRTPLFANERSILYDLLAGRLTLWVGGYHPKVEIVVLICLVQYPAGRTMRVIYAGGKHLHRTLPYVRDIEAWAMQQGCTHIEMITRKGVIRLLGRFGYAPKGVYVVKPIVAFDS